MNSLALPIKATGRPLESVKIEIDREIEVFDLPRAQVRTFEPRPLDVIRSHHHELAWIIASGKTQHEAAALTGRSESRISTLMRTKSFNDLVQQKRADIEAGLIAEHRDAVRRTNDLQLLALDTIHERLEDEPSQFSNSQLLAIVSDTSDRVGPMKKQTNVSVSFDFAERLAAARRKMYPVESDPRTLSLTHESPSLEQPRTDS